MLWSSLFPPGALCMSKWNIKNRQSKVLMQGFSACLICKHEHVKRVHRVDDTNWDVRLCGTSETRKVDVTTRLCLVGGGGGAPRFHIDDTNCLFLYKKDLSQLWGKMGRQPKFMLALLSPTCYLFHWMPQLHWCYLLMVNRTVRSEGTWQCLQTKMTCPSCKNKWETS